MKSKSKHVHKHLTDPEFKYTPAHKTNIRKTFARIRREMAEEALNAPPTVKRTVAPKSVAPAAVTPIRGRAKG